MGCGRGVGNWYSVEGQVARGRQYAQQIESQIKLINDPVITEYVNRVGQNLVRNSDAQVPFTIKVIDSDVVNAMALPGGFFYVNSGLILAADEEAEMAGVMAHEIAHVAACHYGRETTRMNLLQLASLPRSLWAARWATEFTKAWDLAFRLTFLHFSRGFEAEADYLGIEYMYRAGYDPLHLYPSSKRSRRWRRRSRERYRKLSTRTRRPQTESRNPQDEIRKILPAKQQYVVTTSEFDEVKATAGFRSRISTNCWTKRTPTNPACGGLPTPATNPTTPRRTTIVQLSNVATIPTRRSLPGSTGGFGRRFCFL